jgi:hypothetical protein
MTLYSYCIPIDDGAAPNPYWGICTLVICKPVIRRNAKKGDWIVATGSKNAPDHQDFSKHLVYAMKLTQDPMSMAEYDAFCQKHLPNKIPDTKHKDYARRVGDCIYDFSQGSEPIIRNGVHNEGNRKRDLGGENALLSDHFYYFGYKPVLLPDNLHAIIRNGQGHKSHSNENYKLDFVDWLESNYHEQMNQITASPQIHVNFKVDEKGCESADIRCKSDDEDEKLEQQQLNN